MLDRIHGQVVFECDGNKCHEVLETETRDFNEARQQLNEAGWETRNVNKEWLHICPNCQAIETEGAI